MLHNYFNAPICAKLTSLGCGTIYGHIRQQRKKEIITAGLLEKPYLNPHAPRLNKKYRRSREELLPYICTNLAN